MADEPSPCQELVELVTDPFENALGPADRARFEAHVAEFSGCDIYLSRMQPTLKLVHGRPRDGTRRLRAARRVP